MSIPTELRRACEFQLLLAYWSTLCNGNAPAPSTNSMATQRVSRANYPFEICLHNFQLGLVYTFRTWVIAGNLNNNLVEHGGERGQRLQDSMYKRAFATFAD